MFYIHVYVNDRGDCGLDMQKILISAPELVVNKLEEKLRHKYDVQIKTIPNDVSAVWNKGKYKKELDYNLSVCL